MHLRRAVRSLHHDILEAGHDPAGGFDGKAASTGPYPAPNDAAKFVDLPFDTSHDGTNGECRVPCLGDPPLLGADANGIYFSVNSSRSSPTASTVPEYTRSRSSRCTASPSGSTSVFRYSGGSLRDGISYWSSPAISPGTTYATANNGTEYFLSALDFDPTLDDQIAMAHDEHQRARYRGSADLRGSEFVDSKVYEQPPAAQQSTDSRSRCSMRRGSAHNPLGD